MPSKRRHWADLFLIFAIVYLGSQMAMRLLFPKQFNPELTETPIMLSAEDATVKSGHHPVLVLRNNTEQEIIIPSRCPEPPVDIFFDQSAPPSTDGTPLVPTSVLLPCGEIASVDPGDKALIDLAPWKDSAFAQLGYYTVRLTIPPQPSAMTGAVLTTSFQHHEADILTQVFRSFVSKPLLNLLVLIASLMPSYDLGLAIIILTIIVKLLLFIPTQHGLQGQRKMQALQPKLEEVRRRHDGNKQKVNEETMKLWKEHKINPFQSCLPILIQFPVLIGLFYAVRDGAHLALSEHLLYTPYRDLPWTFETMFLGIDLLKPSVYIFPPLLVVLQFLQMKLTFAIAKKKKDAKDVKDLKETQEKKTFDQQQMQQKVMLYALPFMIGFFAIKFPAAVSLYWGVSTVFAIGQQIVVNRKS